MSQFVPRAAKAARSHFLNAVDGRAEPRLTSGGKADATFLVGTKAALRNQWIAF